MEVAREFERVLTKWPDKLDELVFGYVAAHDLVAQLKASNDAHISGGPASLAENARHCAGPVQWEPMDAENFAYARKLRAKLRGDAD